ncbi:hypothetical protein [Companilactobacillus ginsenosidimutans]|uniref:Uncharacterized protein n=1 Tax=Companilactobacillus ginsenosidimutans TaxID=1007676 RepID=A0A0H4QKB6_9LACO|nr:hypothetical protein [Companilactobacillus ginsenosidimutans]AKP67501.1 hypothetical protein ABM34_08145 [Companilactobacillus ginsenosidimutans]
MIDKLTDCLEDSSTGQRYKTYYKEISVNIQFSKRLKKLGWRFDWEMENRPENSIIQLSTVGSDQIQGLICFEIDDGFVKVKLVESAPKNIGHGNGLDGVGGHLFAIAARASVDNGGQGYVRFMPKTNLRDYYSSHLRAETLPNGYMILNSVTSKWLVNKYLGDVENE